MMAYKAAHAAYHEIIAVDRHDLGVQLGSIFRDRVRSLLNSSRKVYGRKWSRVVQEAGELALPCAEKYYPDYVVQLRGYAESAGIDFHEFWAYSLGEDDLLALRKTRARERKAARRLPEHCTGCVTNSGMAVMHNEDWDVDSSDAISVIQCSLGAITCLELYYSGTLGGNAFSIRNDGRIISVNSMWNRQAAVGVPSNVFAAALRDAKDTASFFRERFERDPRAGYASYGYTIREADGTVHSIESTSEHAELLDVPIPFAHTNHYLQQSFVDAHVELNLDGREIDSNTLGRLELARRTLKPRMTVDELKALSSSRERVFPERGQEYSIFNEETIARAVADMEAGIVHIWLRREKKRGWVPYPVPGVSQQPGALIP